MVFKLTEEQIEKAAQWWADRVCAPTFDGLSNEERKKPTNRGYQMAELMAAILTEPVEADQREKFIAALKEELQSELYNPWQGLGVDYGPDSVLARAAEKAGVSTHNFPWKTHMGFDEDGTVKAACGYGAPFIEL
jgi:hypothetical protein